MRGTWTGGATTGVGGADFLIASAVILSSSRRSAVWPATNPPKYSISGDGLDLIVGLRLGTGCRRRLLEGVR